MLTLVRNMLIATTSEHSQIIIVSHSQALF
jgi:predicted ATPase